MIDASFIEKIQDLDHEEIVKSAAGREYATGPWTPIKDPQPEPLQLHTLQGLVDWYKSTDNRPCMIHVVGHDKVEAIGLLRPQWCQRDVYARVSLPSDGGPVFSRYMPLEEMIITLQARFDDNGNRAEVLAYIGNVRGELVVTATDDGVTQAATVRNAIGRLDQKPINPIVHLAPYRTFAEVVQPVSDFLLRLKSGGEGGLPTAALFEADGGAWRLEAIRRIRAWIVEQLGDTVQVIA